MKKRSKLRKGLAMLLTATMVVGLIPDMGIMKVSAEVVYNENGFADDGSYQPATLTTGTYDIDGNGENDNVYEIGNAGQLFWFAGLVNGTLDGVTQNTSAYAVLTNDITMNTGVLDNEGILVSDTGSFISWTPIGNRINGNDIKYTGTFDGKGYTISGLYFADSTVRLGFFGYVGSGGSVSNVGIVDSYFSGGDYAGGVCGVNYGSVTNCYHTGVVNGTNSVGGVCGANSGSITNCYHTGAVSGSNTGGVCGVNDSSGNITNCYYETMDGIAGGIKGSDVTGKAQGKATKEFSDGVVAYLLSHGSIDGSIWGQTLTEEAQQVYPVLGGAAVYRICKNGSASYANNEGDNEHLYDNGICSGCGVYEVPAYINDCYQIANKGNLYWFAGLVNGDASVCTGGVTQNTSASAVLTNDITVNTGVLDGDGKLTSNPSSFTGWTPIGNLINGAHIKYTGTFDGKGHTISGLYFAGSTSSTSRLGFFGYVGSGGSVSNVGIVDSYFSGGTYAGGVCGDNRSSGTITNCYYAGVVSGTNAGGVCGFNGGSITNCCHTGAVSGTNAGGVCGSNSGSITNCYYETMDGIAGGIEGSDVTGMAEGKATQEFSDGEVAYLLSHGSIDGSIWGQTLTGEGQQAYPVLGGAAVYRICKNGSASYSNNEGDNEHLYDNGICSGCGVYKVPAYENDCYQIANKGNLYWFAGLVNGDASVCTGGVTQNTSASAVLTQDITVNTGVLDGGGKLTSNPSSFTGWTPIGNYINKITYTGTFDGKGHTISGLYYAGSTSYLGFFGYVGNGGSVSNVGIVDSYFSGGTYAGGVCGENHGSITNCYHAGAVNGINHVGGVCGYNAGAGRITNCYHTGSVSGNCAGGVCGSNVGSGRITNCYYETMEGIGGGINGSDVTGMAEGKATQEFSDGVVAYLLSSGTDGSIWGQTLTEEAQQSYPVLGGTTVYRICKNGSASYSNNEGGNEHLYDNGICSGCGVYKVPAYENDCYQIANKGNLYWFAGLVNGDASVCTGGVTQNTSASAVLTQDITVNTGVLDNEGTLARDTTGFISWTPIGNYINKITYTGTFDGKGHTISGLYYAGSTSYLGFFGYVGSGGSVSNVGIVDSYFSGGTNAGGVCGYNYGSITNCYYAGVVNGEYAGGVCGYNSSSASITNCYHTGAVNGTRYAGGVCGYNSSSGNITNCYYETMDGIAGGIKGSDVTGKAEGKATEEFSDGVVAYLLSIGTDGSIWGQTLTEEAHQAYPVLGGAAVYRICKNGSASYSNHDGESVHQYDNGICSGCGVYEVPAYINDCYQIANKGNLYWFAGLVNGDAKICTGDVTQNTSANAVLTQDITVNTGVLDEDGKLTSNPSSFTGWTPIGNYINGHIMYTGTFDGKGHTISGLYYAGSTSSAFRLGFFGYVGSGGSVSNVGIVDSYFSGGTYAGGVCGDNYGSITNCYHTGAVSGTDAGGVCGDNRSSGTITNCYHTGAVNGTKAGGVCGYNNGSITNCYHTGAVSGTNTGGVCGYNYSSGNITNCYYETMDGITGGINGSDVTGKAQGKATQEFSDGVVAYLLSSGTDGSIWGQTLTGEDQQAYPVLGGPKVYLKGTYTGCECNPGEPTSTDGYSNNKEDTVYSEHTMTAHSANNATCTKDGNLAYWTCSNGEGLYYKDEAGTEKYNSYDDDIKLPATGHTDEDLDGKCDTCDTYLDGIGARLAGHSLTLDGSVGVNFYMELSSEVISDSSAYMEFTLPGGKTSTVKVNEAPTEEISGKTYYKFRCQVNAAEMTDTIKAQLKSTVGNSKVYEYTVKEYADYLFEHKEGNEEFTKAAALIEAMVNYGSYAQIYAGYNADNLAVGESSKLKPVTDVTLDASKYTYTPNENETKVQFAGANLSLLSTTTLRMYFKITNVDVANVSFTYGGNTLEKTQSGDYYYVELVGIPASKLDDDCVVTVNDGTNSFDVTYTPMAYCANVINREITETRTESLKNLMKALVVYNQAADAYIGNTDNGNQ